MVVTGAAAWRTPKADKKKEKENKNQVKMERKDTTKNGEEGLYRAQDTKKTKIRFQSRSNHSAMDCYTSNISIVINNCAFHETPQMMTFYY